MVERRGGERVEGFFSADFPYLNESLGLRALQVEPIPADIGEAPGNTLDRLQVHHRAAVFAIQNLNMPYKLRLF